MSHGLYKMDKTEFTVSDCKIKQTSAIYADKTLDDALTLIKKNNYAALVVVDGEGKPLGTITQREIVRSRLKQESKVSNILHKSPKLSPKASLAEAASLLFGTSLKTAVVADSTKIIGVITDDDVLDCAKNMPIGKEPIKRYMSSRPLALSSSDTIASALATFRHHNISRGPVTENGSLIGIITLHDIVTKLALAKSKKTEADISGEKIRLANAKVEWVMTKNPITCSPDDNVSSVIDVMVSKKITSLPIVGKEGKLTGVVTKRDLLRPLAELNAKQKKIQVQIVGVSELDSFERSRIMSELNDFAEKLETRMGQGLLKVQFSFFKEHVKETRLTRTIATLTVSEGKFQADVKAWGPYASVKSAVKAIQRQFEESMRKHSKGLHHGHQNRIIKGR